MVTGKVVRFDHVRGYGFIAPHSGGEDVFLHTNDLIDEKYLVQPGSIVEFEVEQGDRGLKASSVRIVERGPVVSGPSSPAHARSANSDGGSADDLCDVLSSAELSQEVTEVLLEGDPTLTGAQIVRVRQEIVALAKKHGWIENY
ncbi:DNA-binding protein [Longimycelium tulufanense]|uniref:DNA-binding protein n=1 Tax=Longimycelium tulufanense TaxID=907463 RepID=A0A8J3FXW6_9PSEU|nr:cold shock domain-containing protein [Longimycelium tulufanense]GGM83164.1 DNA-binding protein [Longimycelium tulufanense]